MDISFNIKMENSVDLHNTVAFICLKGEDKNITSINLTMCKAPLKIIVLWWKTLVLNSNRQKKNEHVLVQYWCCTK